jgi:sodium transport system permease protein
MFGPIGVVAMKEVVDNVRDRRALASALLYPLLGPVLMVLLFTVVERSFADRVEGRLQLPVAGASEAPDLVDFLGQHGVAVLPAPPDPEDEVRSGRLDVVLVIPRGFAASFSRGEPAVVQLVVDESRQSAGVSVQRARRVLEAFGNQTAALRLLVRGISPDIITPLAIEQIDLATPQSQAARFLNLLPYFLIFSIFIGGMYLAIDSTAGERERGSLEPLVMNPISRRDLVLGKLCAVLLFTAVAVGETLLAFAVVLRVAPLENILGVSMSLDWQTMVAAFVLALPMMPLAGALQMIIASFTRSFKEAQNYLSMLPLVPALPGMFLAFVPFKPDLWTMFVPTFSQQILINQVMRGESVATRDVLVASGTTLLVAVLLTAAAVALYRGERVIFGGSGD